MGILGDVARLEFQIIAANFHEWNVEAIFGQIDVSPPWIGGYMPIVNLHLITYIELLPVSRTPG